MSVTNWFMQGGAFMWYVMFVDVLAVVLIATLLIVYKRNKLKSLMIAVVILSLLPSLPGIFGTWVGYQQAMSALSMVDPAQKQELYEASMAVARIPSMFGIISTAVLLFTGVAGLKLR